MSLSTIRAPGPPGRHGTFGKIRPAAGQPAGCGIRSTSEILGGSIGHNGSLEAAQAVYEGMAPVLQAHGIHLAAQCCEHLNRALIVERSVALARQYEEVCVVPQPHAGGSWATVCWQQFTDPVAVETIRAEAGIDIGDTLIGMHLRAVAVPVRLSVSELGTAPGSYVPAHAPNISVAAALFMNAERSVRFMEYTACTPTLDELKNRITAIRARMEKAALESGRDPASVRLCAACKTRTVETVRLSAQCAIDLFGENHVQELVEKKDAGAYLAKPCHFIGHLQTNKIKKVVGRADVIESVDLGPAARPNRPGGGPAAAGAARLFGGQYWWRREQKRRKAGRTHAPAPARFYPFSHLRHRADDHSAGLYQRRAKPGVFAAYASAVRRSERTVPTPYRDQRIIHGHEWGL